MFLFLQFLCRPSLPVRLSVAVWPRTSSCSPGRLCQCLYRTPTWSVIRLHLSTTSANTGRAQHRYTSMAHIHSLEHNMQGIIIREHVHAHVHICVLTHVCYLFVMAIHYLNPPLWCTCFQTSWRSGSQKITLNTDTHDKRDWIIYIRYKHLCLKVCSSIESTQHWRLGGKNNNRMRHSPADTYQRDLEYKLCTCDMSSEVWLIRNQNRRGLVC